LAGNISVTAHLIGAILRELLQAFLMANLRSAIGMPRAQQNGVWMDFRVVDAMISRCRR